MPITPEDVERMSVASGCDQAFAQQHAAFFLQFAQAVQAHVLRQAGRSFTPRDAAGWSLYASMPGADRVAQALNDKLQSLLDEGLPRAKIDQAMSVCMREHADFGAYDSEPLYVLEHVLDGIFGRPL
jgi:DNA-binding FadR family transcriptional regulator